MKWIRIMLVALIIVVTTQLSAAGREKIDIEKVVAATNTFLKELNDCEELSLAVMIAKDGVPVLEKAYDLANRSFKVPNRIDTKFNLASMNKMFTAVAIMQLVQKGKLRLEDKIGDILPDYPNTQVKDSVTVYQLLTHTAGMGNIFGPLYDQTPVNRFQTVCMSSESLGQTQLKIN